MKWIRNETVVESVCMERQSALYTCQYTHVLAKHASLAAINSNTNLNTSI